MPAKIHVPSGFYSYKHLEGADRAYLNKLRINLEHELLTVTGRPVKLWQDIEGIEWGQEWKQAIKKGLAEAVFFIPVITPGYLFSEVCVQEFEEFAAFEKKLGRTDLILPLIYVWPDDFDDEEQRKSHPVIKLCLERQFMNWEDLRTAGDETAEYRTRLTQLSKRIGKLLRTLPPGVPVPAATAPVKGPGEESAAASDTSERAAMSEEGETRPPAQRILYVNKLGPQGTFQSIGKALKEAAGGDRISVAPGQYNEEIVLDKPVVIAGEGNPGEVTISVKDAHVVSATAAFGRLQNLTLRERTGVQESAPGSRLPESKSGSGLRALQSLRRQESRAFSNRRLSTCSGIFPRAPPDTCFIPPVPPVHPVRGYVSIRLMRRQRRPCGAVCQPLLRALRHVFQTILQHPAHPPSPSIAHSLSPPGR